MENVYNDKQRQKKKKKYLELHSTHTTANQEQITLANRTVRFEEVRFEK
jgi:hypothetical protein